MLFPEYWLSMANPVLLTKLHIPFQRQNLVPRLRLLETLNLGLAHRLILISAPAGYGKSTLIGEWIRETKLTAAWVSLDEGDNDLARFLDYCVAAIQTVFPEAGKTTQVMLQSPQRPAIEACLSLLINDLVEVERPIILVLDDYHLIQSQAVHDAVTFLLNHLPPQMHLVISTRADPPLPISRLRARGQLTELRLSDLQFRREEAAVFFTQMMGFSLAALDQEALIERAEGWATGLQLATLAMQAQVSSRGIEALPSFVHSFTGSHRYILDYLVEEVLQYQPGSIQDFLQRTCILERFCPSLCEALLKGDESPIASQPTSSVLEYLDRSNLFLVSLDDRRQWYRYHHLFSDLLNQRLMGSQPDLVPVLHRRASAWFEQNGWINEAIEHAIAAQDFERAVEMISQAAEPTLMRSEVVTYMHWIERLPEAILQNHPRLVIFQTWGLLFAGHSKERIEACLNSLASLAESPLSAPIRGYIALFQGDIGSSIELFRLALNQLPEEEHLLRGLAATCLANAYLSEYKVTSGIRALEEVAQESQKTGNTMLAALVYSNLAEISRKLGQLHLAQDYFLKAIDLATDTEGRRLPVAGRPLSGLSDLKREWNDLKTAEKYLTESINLSRFWMQAGFIHSTPPLVRLKMAQGAWEEAQDIITQARKAAADFTITQIDDYIVEMYQAWLWVKQGNLEEAARWVAKFHIEESFDELPASGAQAYNLFHMRKYEQLILARLNLAQNEPEKALRLLETLLPKFEKIGRQVQVIEIHILQAIAWLASNRLSEATAKLLEALRLAQPEGYLRLFLDEGDPVYRLLERIKAADTGLDDYIQKLLAAFGGEIESQDSLQAARVKATVDPLSLDALSQREMEILHFLAGTLSADEIARKLFVSVHTVRSHMKKIYSKLDVHGRLEAVERARELQLLHK
jgi:LuxR family maltose regulon positive regulatory protein